MLYYLNHPIFKEKKIMTFIPTCPLATSLTQAAAVSCEVVTGQIVGMAFQITDSGSEFADLATIQAEANWTAFEVAVDATKMVYSYTFAQGLSIPSSERNEVGVDSNESPGGVGILNGSNTVLVTGSFYGLDGTAITAMETLSAYSLSAKTKLKAYFILEGRTSSTGRVMCATDGTKYMPVEIYNLRISSKEALGFNTKDVTKFDFRLKSNWDRDTTIVEGLDFDPKDKLL